MAASIVRAETHEEAVTLVLTFAAQAAQRENEACAVVAERPLAPTVYAENYACALAKLIRARHAATNDPH